VPARAVVSQENPHAASQPEYGPPRCQADPGRSRCHRWRPSQDRLRRPWPSRTSARTRSIRVDFRT
jgi:hypothetical protein